MKVTIRYHVGWLGTVPPSAFENEVRQRIVSESEGRAFSLAFEPKPGTGVIAVGDIVSCEGGRPSECRTWEEVIGDSVLPDAWAFLARSYGHASR